MKRYSCYVRSLNPLIEKNPKKWFYYWWRNLSCFSLLKINFIFHSSFTFCILFNIMFKKHFTYLKFLNFAIIKFWNNFSFLESISFMSRAKSIGLPPLFCSLGTNTIFLFYFLLYFCILNLIFYLFILLNSFAYFLYIF